MTDLPSQTALPLDPLDRLALAYAPRSSRPAWEALLLFMQRLTETAKPGREPLMIQLRLAWWRDRMSEPAERWPKGEPLLARLRVWETEAPALVGLIDGWEASIVGEDGGVALRQAETCAYVALARLLGDPDLDRVGDVAQRLHDPHDGTPAPKLSRAMRPLAIRYAFARRLSQQGQPSPLRDLAALIRVGLFGR